MTGKSEIVLETPGQKTSAPDAGDNSGEGANQYGGFQTVEELVAAYESGKAPKADEGGTADTKAPKGIEVDEGASDDADDKAVTDALSDAGLDQDVFTQEFAETGELSEESFKALEKAGFPRQMVDVYVRGLQADQASYSAAVYGAVGGEEGYADLIGWAKDNTTADEKRAFNEAVTSGDPARAAMAVSGMASRRGGGKSRMLHGKAGASGAGSLKPFQSLRQVTEAKRDPRYRNDPAYRTEISERLRASQFLS